MEKTLKVTIELGNEDGSEAFLLFMALNICEERLELRNRTQVYYKGQSLKKLEVFEMTSADGTKYNALELS